MGDAIDEVKEAFAHTASRVAGVLLFGSHARGDAHPRSDIDVCIVAGPSGDPGEAFSIALRDAGAGGREFDVKVFETLPLYLKGEVLSEMRVVHTVDRGALEEYLHRWRKLWNDECERQRLTPEDVARIVDVRHAQMGA